MVSPRITDDDNRMLMAPYTEGEVTKALFSSGPHKSPGHDGFSANFLQHACNIVKQDFVKDALQFLNHGRIDPETNLTIIVLIPKIDGASKIQQFRPISLCTILARTISKAMTTRLQPLLDKVIYPNQSAFIKGRSIMDNVVIAQELLHFMRTNTSKNSHWGL